MMGKLVSSPPESLLASLTPALRAKYEAFASMIDAAHGLGAWPRPASDAERALNAIAEKIPFAYQEISDADFAALRAHLADAQVVPLVMALCLHDAHRRQQIAWPAPNE
jgi:hypothetical protein